MDPNATLYLLIMHATSGERNEMVACALDLSTWLGVGGFAPTLSLTFPFGLPPSWER